MHSPFASLPDSFAEFVISSPCHVSVSFEQKPVASKDQIAVTADGEQEFYVCDGEVFRAPLNACIMSDGYRCGRWECSLAHFERFRSIFNLRPSIESVLSDAGFVRCEQVSIICVDPRHSTPCVHSPSVCIACSEERDPRFLRVSLESLEDSQSKNNHAVIGKNAPSDIRPASIVTGDQDLIDLAVKYRTFPNGGPRLTLNSGIVGDGFKIVAKFMSDSRARKALRAAGFVQVSKKPVRFKLKG